MTDQELIQIFFNASFHNTTPQERLRKAKSNQVYKHIKLNDPDAWKTLKYKGRTISSTGRISLKFSYHDGKGTFRVLLSDNEKLGKDRGHLIYNILSDWTNKDPYWHDHPVSERLYYSQSGHHSSYESCMSLCLAFAETGIVEFINGIMNSLDVDSGKILEKKKKYKSKRNFTKIKVLLEELFHVGVDLEEVIDLTREVYVSKIQNS